MPRDRRKRRNSPDKKRAPFLAKRARPFSEDIKWVKMDENSKTKKKKGTIQCRRFRLSSLFSKKIIFSGRKHANIGTRSNFKSFKSFEKLFRSHAGFRFLRYNFLLTIQKVRLKTKKFCFSAKKLQTSEYLVGSEFSKQKIFEFHSILICYLDLVLHVWTFNFGIKFQKRSKKIGFFNVFCTFFQFFSI
jgi:hypothetical protein